MVKRDRRDVIRDVLPFSSVRMSDDLHVREEPRSQDQGCRLIGLIHHEDRDLIYG